MNFRLLFHYFADRMPRRITTTLLFVVIATNCVILPFIPKHIGLLVANIFIVARLAASAGIQVGLG
jgi:hypothetical protein